MNLTESLMSAANDLVATFQSLAWLEDEERLKTNGKQDVKIEKP